MMVGNGINIKPGKVSGRVLVCQGYRCRLFDIWLWNFYDSIFFIFFILSHYQEPFTLTQEDRMVV
jgi:hypothetical protein